MNLVTITNRLYSNANNQQAASSHSPLVSSKEAVHRRLDDFIEEPLGAGNRNVMLPDKTTDADLAIKDSRERMERSIANAGELWQ
ncbi:hypothetical protein F4811DRAFT_508309 [Daldinia bambusicola]|nr:hypothetical protein F4811DRAFT_508309 [Daldinia bambusicola]